MLVRAMALSALWTAMVEAKGLLILKGQQELRHNPAAYMNFSERLLRVAGGRDPSKSREHSPRCTWRALPRLPSRLIRITTPGARHGAFHGNFHVGSSNVGWPDIRRVGNLHEHGGQSAYCRG